MNDSNPHDVTQDCLGNPIQRHEDSPPISDPDSSAHGRFLAGTKIAGRYRIVSLAGRGGMGEVYRADDLKLGHPVALKFLPRGVAESSRRFQLFVSEVRLSRQLAHPNVCRVYDIDEVDGQHFLSMEYIDGEDLKCLLRRIGRLPRDKGIEIAQQLCAGLAAAHEKGVLHRDLKPANVMIDGRGQARITDFGLACLEEDAQGVGEISGTPAYMAPEQLARGETTIQSDLYSLGLVLYEGFTGQPAHQSGSIEELKRAHAASSTRPPAELVADIDPAVERAILHSLENDPRQRPASARALADVFDIQDDISRAIVAALEVQLGGQADAKLVRPQTASLEAYELYVKGRGHWNQRGLGLKKGLHYFELALVEDPNYALAWSGLADAYFLLGFYDFLPIREAVVKAKTAAEKAVALDEHSAEAHCSLGVVLGYCDWDLYGSEQHLLKALELNSNYTPARYWHGHFLIPMGRGQESITQNRRAVEGDPLSKTAHLHLGMSFNSLRWFAETLPPLRRSLELDPNFAISHQQLGRAYWFLGDREAALVELHRAVELSGRLPMFLSTLGQALALSGQVGQARQIQRELAERTVPVPTRPYYLSLLHAALGENDLAFAALEQALIERECLLAVGRSHIELMSLESDPRWPVFIEKVKAAVQASASRDDPEVGTQSEGA